MQPLLFPTLRSRSGPPLSSVRAPSPAAVPALCKSNDQWSIPTAARRALRQLNPRARVYTYIGTDLRLTAGVAAPLLQ